MKKIFYLSGIAILSFALAGCGSVEKKPMQVSIAVSYDSVEQVAADSEWIVVEKAISAEELAWQGVPFTATTVEIVEVVSGTGLGEQIKVLQTGDSTSYIEGLADILTPNEEYLLFLQPLGVEPPVPGADYTVVGFGAYRSVDDSGEVYEMDELTIDGLGSGFDSEITREELQELR